MQVVPESSADHAPTTGGNMLVVLRVTDYVIQVFFSPSWSSTWVRALVDRPGNEWTAWNQVNMTTI